MIRPFAIAAGLVILAFVLVELSPLDRSVEVPIGFASASSPISTNHASTQDPGSTDPVDVASAASPRMVTRAGRNVTADGMTSGQRVEGELRRIAPRHSLGPTALRKPAAPADTPAAPVTEPAVVSAANEAVEDGGKKTPDDADTRDLVLLPRPIAIDAGHLEIGEATVALPGIEPLPLDAQCGAGEAAWPCGMRARTALRNYLRSRSVRCEAPEDFGRSKANIESRCTLGGQDIGRWIVAQGWAKATSDGPYAQEEDSARSARHGIWR